MELPEVLVLAHQFLQLFLEIQPGGQPHRMEGRGLRQTTPTWPRPGSFMSRPVWQGVGSLLMFFARLGATSPP